MEQKHICVELTIGLAGPVHTSRLFFSLMFKLNNKIQIIGVCMRTGEVLCGCCRPRNAFTLPPDTPTTETVALPRIACMPVEASSNMRDLNQSQSRYFSKLFFSSFYFYFGEPRHFSISFKKIWKKYRNFSYKNKKKQASSSP